MPTPSPQHEEASSDLLSHRLAALRAELDRIDDALHDGLMRRAELVAQVGALGAKGRVPLRPGREASIIRRLLARNDGALAPETLVRIWREMLAGSSAQQHPMTVAVASAALVPLAQEHFGAFTPVTVAGTEQVLASVREGRATAALLPVSTEREHWWTALLTPPTGPRVHIVARLPFWRRHGATEGLLLTAAAPDPSGADRTLIGAVLPSAGAAAAFGATLTAAGFAVGASVSVADAALADIAGFVTAADPRLAPLAVPRAPIVLGAYAIPVGDCP